MNKLPKPTPKQLAWADMELGVIIHHCMETYHPDIPVNQWKCSPERMPASSFAPTDEDTDGWLAAAHGMGARYAILVTNHVTGFSLWPTKENTYSIAASPYQNGRADIVRDFIASCRKYNIAPGLYYSTGCNGYYGINDSVPTDYHSEHYQAYVRMVERQLAEIWGNYGELFELWFDGGVIPVEKGGPDVLSLIRTYQPDAVCFQGPAEHHQNLRWVGNERGVAPIDCWSTSDRNTCAHGGDTEAHRTGVGNPDGMYWIPAETDMANRRQSAFGGGWGWRADEEHLLYTPQELLERYLTSVGRNSNLLMGMCISQRGHFEDGAQFHAFGELIRGLYASAVARTEGTGMEFTVSLSSPAEIRHAVIEEDLTVGERVRRFHLDAVTPDGQTVPLLSAHCIGHKRIVPVNLQVTALRLYITAAAAQPQIKAFTLYA